MVVAIVDFSLNNGVFPLKQRNLQRLQSNDHQIKKFRCRFFRCFNENPNNEPSLVLELS